MKVSIIIPVKKINNYIRESIPKILDMDYPDYEILIFPDISSKDRFIKTRIIPTGSIGPAEKRDLALKYSKGEILLEGEDKIYTHYLVISKEYKEQLTNPIFKKLAEDNIRSLFPQKDNPLSGGFRQGYLAGMGQAFMPDVTKCEARIYQDAPIFRGQPTPQAPHAERFRGKYLNVHGARLSLFLFTCIPRTRTCPP